MLKILSIDDSKAVHSFLDDCFSETGHELDHVLDSTEGLKILLEGKKSYDLVLLDWEMPNLSGPEVLKELFKNKFETPVIMLTSRNSMDDISTGLESGAVEYLLKPFTRDIILDKISTVLDLQ